MPMNLQQRFLSMTEVCVRLHLRYPTVLKMLHNGVIKGAYKVGNSRDHRYRRWRIPESEVIRIMTTKPQRGKVRAD